MQLEFILKDGRLPKRGSGKAAGLDIHTNVGKKVSGRSRVLFSTGVFLNQVPDGTYLRIAPRSKLANKFGLDVFAGVVDADYRGEIMVIIYNSSNVPVQITKGDAIAQLILEKIAYSEPIDVTHEEAYSETARGDSGINSQELRE